MPQTWKDKWKSVNSKFATCVSECVTHYRSDDKCRDSIEAVVADIWNPKDWLINDTTASVPSADIYAFLDTEGFNIRACGDIETKQKHLRINHPRREDTELIWEGNHAHPSGYPVIFSVTRRYKDSDSTDHWEDAFELTRRAIEEWRKFLTRRALLLEQTADQNVTPTRNRPASLSIDGAKEAERRIHRFLHHKL
jgi:hypothetical protein